jgi:uncharacterized SAM-binding protein YcdF (DUF218 family)
LAVLVVVSVLAVAWAKPALFVEGGSKHADVIVILGGDAGDRTFRALELYKAGAAPKIIISGDGDWFLIRDRLVLAGVSTNAIIIEPNSRNTRENAEFSVRLMKTQGARKAIVVTSWFHSRRALGCFGHFGSDLEFSSFPAYQGMTMDRKPSPSEVPNVVREYLGITWYLVRYGIAPISPVSEAR